jgi:YidC/Oxa1 family membrane protein insertase
MERRLLLAIVLTFVVLTAYQWLMPVPPSAPAPQAGAAATTTPQAPPPEGAVAPTTPAITPPAPQAAVETVVADTAERTLIVDNGVVRAVFSNRGATLAAWELLAYAGANGRPVDLVPHDLPPNQPKPFSLRLEDAATSERLNTALFSAVGDPSSPGTPAASLDAKTAPVTITFEYQDAAGLHARKQFRLEPNSYIVSTTVSVTDGGRPLNPFVQWGPGLGDVLESAGGSMFMPLRKSEAIYSIDGDVERIQAAALNTTPRYQGNYQFAGVDTHYFMAVAVKPGSAELEYHPVSVPSKAAGAVASRDYVAYDVRFQPTANGPVNAQFFVGPKHFETLRQTDAALKSDAELVRAVWFGMFAFLSVPLLSALNWVNGFIGNYGWSIIALTFIINAAMFPLRHKSNVSMRKMQAIQPQVKAIQDRYKDLKATDPARQKMNTEMMELYRQKGVNPASGCVPMLLTFPVLLAFYGLLSEAIELRNAPFIWWIHDLAAPDPFYVTPILMGASQVWQQKMMPMAGVDPVQQKMMLFMPILFTFLFLTSPAGLALYWFASNVLVIGQQVLTNRMIGPPGAPAPKDKTKKLESKN